MNVISAGCYLTFIAYLIETYRYESYVKRRLSGLASNNYWLLFNNITVYKWL